jgi:ornithine cyclodeaminase/alanine dehydrogenase
LNLAKATQQSDVVVTCTPSKRFYVHKSDIKPGTFLAAVGADSHDKQELEPSLLVDAKVVVDLLHQCSQVGELHHALAAGLLTAEDVHAELGAVVAGRVPGRTSFGEITIFDATGTALQDTAAAVLAYQRAIEAGLGVSVRLPA